MLLYNKQQMKRSIINLKHHSDTFIKQPKFSKKKKKCILTQMNHQIIGFVLNYLRLSEIVHLYYSFQRNPKVKEVKRSVIHYLILSYRFYSKWEEQEYVEVLVRNNKNINPKRTDNQISRISSQSLTSNTKGIQSNNEKSRITRCQENIKYDVQRTFIRQNNIDLCHPRDISSSMKKQVCFYSQQNLPKSSKNHHLNKITIQNMQDYLNRVLLNVSKKYPQIGYIQGLNYIVKTMFLTGLSEEHAYNYLCFFLQRKKFSRILVNGMIGLKQLSYSLKVYTYNYVPRVYAHFEKCDVEFQIFATSWFITLFSEDLPLFITNKIWHLFALQGWKALIQFSLAVLCALQNQITAQNGDEIFSYLRKIMRNFQQTTNRSARLQATVWKLMSSIEVSNKMIDQLCQQMQIMQYDSEIELWKVENLNKKWKKSRAMSERSLLLEHRSNSPIGTRVCCDRISPSPSASMFPFCHNIGSQCQ